MTEQKKDDVKTNKKRGKLYGIVSSVAIFCIIVFLAKFLGRKAGRQAAMQTVQQESIAQNAPATGESAVGSSLPARNSRFALVNLPLGVSIEAPKNWRLLDGDFNTTIEAAGEAALSLAGIKLPTGQKVNLFRANSNPPTTYAGIAINATDSDIPPAELLAASDAEIREFAPLMHQMLDQGFAAQNLRVIRFDGVRRETVDGHPALVIEYVRSGPQGPVVVQMTRLFIGDKEISLNLSYRRSEAAVWKPIVDHMRSTFRVSRPSPVSRGVPVNSEQEAFEEPAGRSKKVLFWRFC